MKFRLGHVFRTVFGFYQKKFNQQWDSLLNEILENGDIQEVEKCTVDFSYKGDVYCIWISNRWYAYGNLYALNNKDVGSELEFRPAFKTMVRLYEITRHKHAAVINRDDDYRRIYVNR
ncbi:hypothetical protein [Serratia proteamaculans]|uniref:Uncharacterized protein n=1 Tax=Serratia proteamaculans TaxID=28151 RepID=A0A5Q2V9S1_SERPR|nr:hypothetical protein [Serratia proteamaculans]QGH60765.1 hypothetical protein GHV41_07870 [Serratia proteamaculans]